LAESNYILSLVISFGSTCSLSEESLNNISDYFNNSISSDSEINEVNNFQTALCEWSIKNNISLLALSELLVLLKIHTNCELPNTARTILKTKRSANHDIINIGNGFYWHYSVEKCIKRIASDIIILNKKVSYAALTNEETINILINIDGLPSTKSSNSCLWPILCSDTRIKKI